MTAILRATGQMAAPLFAFAVLLVAWEVLVRVAQLPSFLLPAPSEVVADTSRLGVVLALHTLATLKTVLAGFALSVVISLPLALALTSSQALSNAIYPMLILSQAIPKVALAPILVVMLGPTEAPRIIVTFLVAFFPLVISCATGLLSVPAELIELSRSLRASKWQEFTRLRLPYALPHVFGGLKVAITLSVVGAVVGEFVAANQGLGYLIVSSTAFFKTPVAFGAMILLAIMGIVLFQIVAIIERRVVPWAPKAGGIYG
ncbi:ABC transporter permease [Pseudooceanicola sp. C21-150M6]|uniref:ABC transporter permease n=1 Tax=Pseudooceanicola sp. C21-150M6 TaxID=3434355 RepID=UPI003D7FC2EA